MLKKVDDITIRFIKAYDALKEKKDFPSNEKLAEIIGASSKSTITEIYKKRQNIQPEQWDKFKTYFKYRDRTEISVPHENQENYQIKEKDLQGDDITKQILFNLSESHKALAIAHQEISTSNRMMMEKEKAEKKATDYDGSEILLAFGGKLEALLEAVIAVGTGKKWKSADEARAELNRKVRVKKEAV